VENQGITYAGDSRRLVCDGQTAFTSRDRADGDPAGLEVFRETVGVGPSIVLGHFEQLCVHAFVCPFGVFLVLVFLLVALAVLGLWGWWGRDQSAGDGVRGLYHGCVCGDASRSGNRASIVIVNIIVVVVVAIVEGEVCKLIELPRRVEAEGPSLGGG
jgi:hypothetical protein